jgi:hypothetical protein
MLELNEQFVRMYPLQVAHFTVAALCRHPSFELTQVDQRPDGLFEFQFRVDPKGEAVPTVRFLCSGGSIVLDPAKSWLPVTYELYWPNSDVRSTGRFSDFRSKDGVWLPFAVEQATKRPDGSVIPYATGRIVEAKIREAIPEEEFTLSAFGLPEPGKQGRGVAVWLWLVGGVLLFLIGGAMLRLRRRAKGS